MSIDLIQNIAIIVLAFLGIHFILEAQAMTRRSISVDELPADVRARVEGGQQASTFVPSHVGPKALVGKPKSTKRDESAIARKRGKTGGDFEADLNMTHRQYEFLKWGKIWPHSPPFVRFKNEWHPKAGGGPVDRTGHVCVHIKRAPDESETWGGVSIDRARARGSMTGRIVPVAFDAKVLGVEHLSYQHDTKHRHQLLQLRDAASVGVFAFLLIYAPKVERLFALGIQNHFEDLTSGRGVKLYEFPQRTNGDRGLLFPLVPSIERGGDSLLWDWIPLLQWCEPDSL